jgi:hypothetical protein
MALIVLSMPAKVAGTKCSPICEIIEINQKEIKKKAKKKRNLRINHTKIVIDSERRTNSPIKLSTCADDIKQLIAIAFEIEAD